VPQLRLAGMLRDHGQKVVDLDRLGENAVDIERPEFDGSVGEYVARQNDDGQRVSIVSSPDA
jgi:hypothetical protein